MTVLAGFIVSLFIELTQYITGRGLCELDDVVHNTIGAFAGIIIYKKIRYLLRNKIDL
jgi:glycopeptide antibiotics resistance protein